MGYKTREELTAGLTAFADYFKYAVPKSFPVHKDYQIEGLSESDFCRCYEIYRRKMLAIQLEMAEKPEDFGLIAENKKGAAKPVHSMANAYVWLFLALGQSGEIKNDVLFVDGGKFTGFCQGDKVGKNESTPKNTDSLLLKLRDFGFAINGPISGDFQLSSDTAGLCSVIKASVLTKYAGMSMTSDYPAFNYRMYKFAPDESLPFEETISYSLMNEQKKEFSSKLISEMKKQGWEKYIFFPHSINGGRLTFPTVEYYYSIPHNSHVLIRITKGFDFKAYMDSLPERYYGFWKACKTCRGCKKECSGRRIDEELFGKKTVICPGNVKVVYECETRDIEYIVDAALKTAGKSKK
ncbi:MAG: hypothetical protein FWD23_00885, partial [Oscillospiraceae bacterium]|nr:hypothetical protein [Oscillospiraceae bacterium]